MAPVELEPSPSFTHTFVRGTDLFLAVGLSAIAGNTIYRSYFAAPPSSAARERQYRRFGHVKLFVALASLSLLTATYYGGSVAWLSYRIWADERGVELPTSFFGDKGAFRGGEHPGRFQLVRWLDETPLYQDAYEFVAEKARYFWWSQQLNLASISWTTFLAIEGRRRNIPNLLAFQLLGQVVSLSYAQNLFFVAMLLTPVPLSKSSKESIQPSSPAILSEFSQIKAKIIPTKPDGWLPHPAFYTAFLIASMTTTFLIPYASNTPSFLTIIHLSQFLPRGMLLLPYVLPQRWGTVPEGPHSAHKTYLTLFRTISTISALLHLKSTTVALFLNTPESHYYRHTLMHPFKSEYRSGLDRSSTAVARLFGAISEHPVVSAVGWDVLLSGLTLGFWTSIRSLDPSALLSASIPFTEQITSKAAAEGMKIELESDHGEEESEIVVHTSRKPALLKRGRGRPKKTESVGSTDDLVSQSPAKLKNNALDPDATYRPADGGKYATEGDEEAREEDWEAAALAWGLVTANLGVGSSAVYGAECVSR